MTHAQMVLFSKARFVLTVQVPAQNALISTHVHNANLLMFCMKISAYLPVHQELILVLHNQSVSNAFTLAIFVQEIVNVPHVMTDLFLILK